MPQIVEGPVNKSQRSEFVRSTRAAIRNWRGDFQSLAAKPLYRPAIIFAGLLVMVGLWIVLKDITEPAISESILSYLVWAVLPLAIVATAIRFPALQNRFCIGLNRLEPKLVGANLAIAVIAIMLFDAIVVRRMVFAVIMVPTAWAVSRLLFAAYFARRVFHEKLTIAFVAVTFAATILPGFYFPPFYDGICGWVSNPKRDGPVRLAGLKLVRDDGESIWFSHSLINPVNFIWRQDQYARDIGGDAFAELLGYYLTLYQNRYALLRDGKFPNQAVLGAFGYPGHNPYRMLPYDAFPPERIVEIAKLNEFYERGTDRLIERRISHVYDVKSKSIKATSDYLVESTK